MNTLINKLTKIVSQAFIQEGYNATYGEVTLSDRPDLCQYQCNGAFSCAKKIKANPIQVANNIVEKIARKGVFKEITIAGAGFINFIVEDEYLGNHIAEMAADSKLGANISQTPLKIIMDYGGPNVGKPLHVGHLRAAIIGESLKKIARFMGNEVISDVHLGDWGLQMGMIIVELKRMNPTWVYFDDNYTGEYPEESPIQFSDFEETYPRASQRAKENKEVLEEARRATNELQDGKRGYIALWKHFIDISTADLKKSYDKLFVQFDLWNGESDVQSIIPRMIKYLLEKEYAYESDGAQVIAVAEEKDDYEIPPFMLSKSDGSSLYSTTDLATILQRVEDYKPDAIWYVVDSRQSLHFKQVFRCAYKTNVVTNGCKLEHLGFGTMNGTDGKPFKTRDGGVMKLNNIIKLVEDNVMNRLEEERLGMEYDELEKKQIAHFAGVAALKFADLMNYRTRDYVFDIEKFSSFEGKTGTYLLYSTVRIKSILKKAKEANMEISKNNSAKSTAELGLQLQLALFPEALEKAYTERAPSYICDFIYSLASEFNKFYHEHRILTEENENTRSSWLGLLSFTHEVMSTCLELLAINVPQRL